MAKTRPNKGVKKGGTWKNNAMNNFCVNASGTNSVDIEFHTP